MKKQSLKVMMPPKTAKTQHEYGQISAVYGPMSSKLPQNVIFVLKNHFVKLKRKKKKLKKLGLKVMMPTLQKQPKFSMKMAESWPFMDRFPPNHHRMFFLGFSTELENCKPYKIYKSGTLLRKLRT